MWFISIVLAALSAWSIIRVMAIFFNQRDDLVFRLGVLDLLPIVVPSTLVVASSIALLRGKRKSHQHLFASVVLKYGLGILQNLYLLAFANYSLAMRDRVHMSIVLTVLVIVVIGVNLYSDTVKKFVGEN